MVSIWVQTKAIARRDLLRERRRGEVLWMTIPFAAISLLLFPLAIGTDAATLQRIGPGTFWVIVMLFGVLVAVRQAGAEHREQRDAVNMLGLDPAAGFAGRAAASFVLLLVFEAIVGAVAVALYDVPLRSAGWLLLVGPLVAAGLAMLGTVAAGVVSSGHAGAAMVPFLVAPLSVPLLLAATQSFEGLRLGRSILGWVLLMVVAVLVIAITGTLTARPLQESG
jgi:heme exporter protein B